jgi:hypothetical protein
VQGLLKAWIPLADQKLKTTPPKALSEALVRLEEGKKKTTELSSAESEPVAQLKQLLKDPNFPLTSNGQFVLSQLDGLTAPGIVNDLS